MDKTQLREFIKEILLGIGLYSENATELLLATIAQESDLGEYIEQIKGPAKGIIQMEPRTFRGHVKYLERKPELRKKIMEVCNISSFKLSDLKSDLDLQICMIRVHYLRIPKALPDATDLNGMWLYYKKYYNSYLGAATMEQFYSNYNKHLR